MTREITDISGKTDSIDCLSCAIAQDKVELRGGSVIRSKYFDVHQDFEIPIPGFMILTSLRHLKSIADFTDNEAAEFTKILKTSRQLQRDVLGIETVYLHQEEDTSHHFHLWLFPRYDWMKEKFAGKSESMRPIMEYARNNMKTDKSLAKLDADLSSLVAAVAKLDIN